MKFKLILKVLIVSISIVLITIGVSFLLPIEYGSIFAKVVLFPGYFLWEVTNVICPPSGSRCFLGSERAFAHHGWALICYVFGWFGLIIATLKIKKALTRHS